MNSIAKPTKKMDRIAEIENCGKLCENSWQCIRMDSFQCSAICSIELTYNHAQVYIIIRKVRMHGCHIFFSPHGRQRGRGPRRDGWNH